MSTRGDYKLHLLALKRAETKLNLERMGYHIAADVKVGSLRADLVVTRPGETIVYEFKVASDLQKDSAQIRRLRAIAIKKGYDFKLVVVEPPRPMSIEVEGLESALSSFITNDVLPDDLESLATAVYVEDVVDVDLSEIDVRNDDIAVEGTGTIEVRLDYGGGESRDGITGYDSFPFHFRATLNRDLEVTKLDELRIDVSSFYE